MDAMAVEVLADDGVECPCTPETFADWLHAVQAQFSDQPDKLARLQGDVCVSLCDAERSQELNRTWRDKDAPTNVLSFGADVAAPDVHILGDLAVCMAVVQNEAAAQQKRCEDHLAHLFVHGVLHLLDYDHERSDEAACMEHLEREILARLSIADPYA